MACNFKLWEKKTKPRIGLHDRVSVKATTITISNKFLVQFKEKYVELHYDEENKVIGLKPTGSGYNGYSIVHEGRSKNMISVRAHNLINFLNIKPDWYTAEWNTTHEMLLFKYEEKET